MITLCFNDIFKNYEEFENYTGQFSLYEKGTAAEEFNKHIYYSLSNRYYNVSLAYQTPEEFKAEFAIAYNQYFKQFLQKKGVVDAIYRLNNEDYELITESMSNMTNNPNYIITDAWETLTYISNQSRGRAKAGKLQAYLNALRELPDAQIDAMVAKFDYLWLDILDSDSIYLFGKEEK